MPRDQLMQLAYDRSLRRYDKEERLHVELTPISKANICPYFGKEIPNSFALGLAPDRIYQMFRDPVELDKAADTSNNIQLLEKHIGVSARDPKKMETVGSTGTDAIFEAPYLKNSLVIWDKAAIDLIESDRKKELSCSYSYTADMTPGSYLGMKYDGVMRDIAFNHVAIVEDGRAGQDVLVADALPLKLRVRAKHMPKNRATVVTSRKALVARGALQAYFSDKLAQDAQIDYSRIVRGITAANWAEQMPVLKSRIKIATKGKLANDAALGGIDAVLKAMDETAEDEMDDDADDEFPDDDEEAKKKKEAEDKARDEKEAKDKRARDKAARDKKARDAMSEEEREAEDKKARDEEEEEEKKKKEAEDKARDKKARDEEREKEKVEDKKAMDAAIGKAKKEWQQEQRELNEARDLVTPIIGAVHAQDSAAAYYELLFDAHKVDTTGIPPSGYRALAGTVIKGLSAKPAAKRVTRANDANIVDFNKRFPDVSRIRSI